MEVLNNIWIAISTPNEGLITILSILAGIVENYLTLFLFMSILNISSNRKNKLIYVSIMTIISVFNLFFLCMLFQIHLIYL